MIKEVLQTPLAMLAGNPWINEASKSNQIRTTKRQSHRIEITARNQTNQTHLNGLCISSVYEKRDELNGTELNQPCYHLLLLFNHASPSPKNSLCPSNPAPAQPMLLAHLLAAIPSQKIKLQKNTPNRKSTGRQNNVTNRQYSTAKNTPFLPRSLPPRNDRTHATKSDYPKLSSHP